MPLHSPAGAAVCFILASLVIAMAFGVSWLVYGFPIADDLFIILLFPAGLFGVAGRRLLLPDVFHLLRVDRRAPVLYLRGFAHDENPNTVGEVAEIFNVVWMPWPRWAFRSLKTLLTLEARLTPALWEVGPVIAVSRPGEMLNLPTACRFKLDDSAWKSVVADLSARGSGRDRGAAEVTARFPGSLQLSARGHSVSSRHRR